MIAILKKTQNFDTFALLITKKGLNQKPNIKDEEIMQCPTAKKTIKLTIINKTLHRKQT